MTEDKKVNLVEKEESKINGDQRDVDKPSDDKTKLVGDVETMKMGEKVDFKVVYNKKKYDITFGLDETVAALKIHLSKIILVPNTMQKLMTKGLAKDDLTLRNVGVVQGSKVMVVGSTVNDVMEVTKKLSIQDLQETKNTEEVMSEQNPHRKVLDQGKPEDVMPGLKNRKERLPSVPLSGMRNMSGGKVRLIFKLELDQVWISTKERTQKVSFSSIKDVISAPIQGHEEYHILGIQLGTTEASRYFIYWVPAQYVDSIKDTILG